VGNGDDHAWPLRVVVRSEQPITFALEPWGDEYTVTSESVIQVVVYGPAEGRPPEIVHEPDRIEVWASAGCTAAVTINGETDAGDERPRVPNIRGLGGTE
jgi:hypothetical protein